MTEGEEWAPSASPSSLAVNPGEGAHGSPGTAGAPGAGGHPPGQGDVGGSRHEAVPRSFSADSLGGGRVHGAGVSGQTPPDCSEEGARGTTTTGDETTLLSSALSQAHASAVPNPVHSARQLKLSDPMGCAISPALSTPGQERTKEGQHLLRPTSLDLDSVEMVRFADGGKGAESSAPYEPSAAHAVDLSSLRRTPLWNVVVNSITYMCTPTSMPATMAQAGWGGGMIMLIYSAVVTYHTSFLLGDICLKYPHLDTFPKVAAEATLRLVQRVSPERAATGQAKQWALAALWVVLILQFITYYLDTVAQIIYIEQYFGELLPESKLCQWQWLLVTWLLTIPVMQIPTLHASRYISVVALAWVLLNVVCMAVEIWLVQPWNCAPGPSYPKTNPLRLLMAASSMAYAFGGHGMFPEEIREMKDPTQWPRVVNIIYGIVVPVYLFSAVAGYAAYGGFSQANLNLNFPNNSVNVVSILMQLPACLYLVYFTNLVLVLQVEMALGVDPTQTFGGTWRFHMPPVLFRFVFRMAFLGSQVLLAEMLLSGEGDTILGMQSLAGAVGMAAFTYFLPFIMHYIFFYEEVSRLRAVYYAVNGVIGMAIMIGGVYASVHELAGSATGFFDGKCRLEYSYAPTSPDDPCYISGIPELARQ